MFDIMAHARLRHGLCGRRSSAVAAFLWVVVAAACDETFEPIAPSDLAFSVFGYLDASADTQWIRIMPIRPLQVTAEDPLDATVTLEHRASGRIIELRDSVFTFTSFWDPDIGRERTYLHNFWTTEAIEPGATYRFSARRAGKEAAEADVEVPRDYEVRLEIDPGHPPGARDRVWVTGLNHLPFVKATAHYDGGCGPSTVPIPYDRVSDDDETHGIAIEKQSATIQDDCGRGWVTKRELWLVGSEAEWPTSGYSQTALGESARTSNVTNAVGFLGGVLTKVIPYDDCEVWRSGMQEQQYCVLRYTSETATVRGITTETYCNDGPIDSVTVRLTEIGRDPARVRTVFTAEDGEFVFGAMEPGVPHELWARAPQVPTDSVFDPWTFSYEYTAWTDIYTIPTDTLTFTPGEELEYDLHFERSTPCGEPPPARE
jgi:hypothetical protein